MAPIFFVAESPTEREITFTRWTSLETAPMAPPIPNFFENEKAYCKTWTIVNCIVDRRRGARFEREEAMKGSVCGLRAQTVQGLLGVIGLRRAAPEGTRP